MSQAALGTLLTIAAGLFLVGLFGVLIRRTILFQLIALEIMLTGPALAFVVLGSHTGDAAGQAMFILILAFSAAEVAVGLALFLCLRRFDQTTDADAVSTLQG